MNLPVAHVFLIDSVLIKPTLTIAVQLLDKHTTRLIKHNGEMSPLQSCAEQLIFIHEFVVSRV